MLSGEGSLQSNFSDCLNEIKRIKDKYPDFYGVFNWEYFDSPPNPNKILIYGVKLLDKSAKT